MRKKSARRARVKNEAIFFLVSGSGNVRGGARGGSNSRGDRGRAERRRLSQLEIDNSGDEEGAGRDGAVRGDGDYRAGVGWRFQQLQAGVQSLPGDRDELRRT